MDLSYFSTDLQDHTGGRFDIKLDRILDALQQIGAPHHRLPPLIHVAGTNGKCSTIAFMKAILEQTGLKVHVYTSPHLLRVNERILLAGKEITDADLLSLAAQLRPTAQRCQLSWFEFLTLIAFQAFTDTPADALLLEAGLGGQFDATNVVLQPLATVFTPISYDHLDYLGPTLSDIARAKSGIIKPHVPIFSSHQRSEVSDVLLGQAQKKESDFFHENAHWSYEEHPEEWHFHTPHQVLRLPFSQGLLGAHQLQNAALAVATLKSLSIFEISDLAIQEGVKSAAWLGRLTKISTSTFLGSFPKGSEFWFDGAHNPAAAKALFHFFNQRKDKPLIVMCGLLKSKDGKAFIKNLKPIVDQFVFVPIAGHDFCYSPNELKEYDRSGITADTLSAGIAHVLKKYSDPVTILVCGSFYLAKEALQEEVAQDTVSHNV
jgi:dihydrofolate synthase/folylpolyglutamate synthase